MTSRHMPSNGPSTIVASSRMGAAGAWRWVGLVAVVTVAAGFRLTCLDRNGYGNPYYAAAVRSMLKSPSNFFFVALDPVGFSSIDKPPLAYWLQAASAWLFGYHGLSLLVPQALLGVGSVVLIVHLVSRAFGLGSGLLAGLFLAVTPVCVADDRTNLPDAALVFVLLLAAWALSVAVESGRWRSLLAAAALIGAAYNVKLTAGLLVVPTFALVWLLAAPGDFRSRAGRLAVAGVVVAAVALSWSIVVDLTPAARRPYVGGTRSNSALELGLVASSFDKILGRRAAVTGARSSRPPTQEAPVGGGPPGFGGRPGPLRFAAPLMAGQITWLVPLALVGTAAAATGGTWRHRGGLALVLWAGWLATDWAVFSFMRGHFHEYYTNAMGPPIAALAGAGTAALHAGWRRGGWRSAGLPLALVVALAWQGYVLGDFPDWRRWLWPTMLAAACAGGMGLAAARVRRRAGAAPRWEPAAAALAIAALVFAPLTWSVMPVVAEGGDRMNPMADPSILARPTAGVPLLGHPAFELGPRGTRKLAAFLVANRRREPIVLAALDHFLAVPLIVYADLPAISLGGFSGGDRPVSPAQAAAMVRRGQFRFVIVASGQERGNPPLVDWIRRTGVPVGPALWRVEPPVDALGAQPRTAAEAALQAAFAQVARGTTLFDLRPELGLRQP